MASTDGSTSEERPPGVDVVLEHPNGTKVYLVGVVHGMPKSSQDAYSAVKTIKPAVVFVELAEDGVRARWLWREIGDPYRKQLYQSGSYKQALKDVLLGYFAIGDYRFNPSIDAAVRGCPHGNEMVQAAVAAQEVGAKCVHRDRDFNVTKKRHMAATAEANWAALTPAFLAAKPAAESLPTIESPPPAETLGDDDKPEKGHGRARPVKNDSTAVKVVGWKQYCKVGGCKDVDAAEAAFNRMWKTVKDRKTIDVNDLATVRDCALPVLEYYRRDGLETGGSDPRQLHELIWGDQRPYEQAIHDALEAVVRKERDVIFARGLWDQADRAGGKPVVGVVGAAHLKGIRQAWPTIGSEESLRRVQELLKDPPHYVIDPDSLVKGYGFTAYKKAVCAAGLVGMGYLAKRWPRAARKCVGAGALALSCGVMYGAHLVETTRRFTYEMITAAEKLDKRGPVQY